ncbi:MAG: ABC transporter ATP-binding protein/permease [Treponema sp.]|jgi:ABC-type multidrug transport system fused ATPase/permease subunit|nr:ABC transporter ATP-binding protein/permease [Treponema sp.]
MPSYRYHLGAYGRLVRYIGAIKTEVALKVINSLGVNATYTAQAVLMARAVSLVFSRSPLSALIPYILGALGAVALRGVLSRSFEIYTKIMAAKVKTKIRFLVFDKILRLGPGYMHHQRSGRIQSMVLDGIESLEPFLVNYVPHIISIAITGIAIGAYLFHLDWLTSLVVIIAMILCVGVPYLTVPLVSRGIVSYWRSYASLSAQYVDSLQGMNTLKAFNAGEKKGTELAADALDFYQKQIRNTALSLIDSGLMTLLMGVASCITAALAAYRTDLGLITTGSVAVFLFLGIECARPMADLNMYWHTSFLGLSVAEGLFEIIDRELSITEKEEPDTLSLDRQLPEVNLHGITFAYRTNVKNALQRVDMAIGAGRTAAIVGPSGSGKSTLVNLLLRFYDPGAGEIRIGGVDIRDYSLDYLQSKIAVVFQETYLFSGTIGDNIRMARPEADDEAVVRASKAANAHEFIMALPQGYQTVISERGATLSGGERQRIAIARAVLKDAPLLILDEATSSVDARSEALIQDALEGIMKNRTTIVIAHRLSTVKNADKIFVLDEGRLVEEGTHEQLLVRNDVYARLVNAQRQATQS